MNLEMRPRLFGEARRFLRDDLGDRLAVPLTAGDLRARPGASNTGSIRLADFFFCLAIYAIHSLDKVTCSLFPGRNLDGAV